MIQECTSKHENLLMRMWSDGFQPYNVITMSSSSILLFVVIMAHVQQYSIRVTSPFALGYKKSEHGNILFKMLRQSKELKKITCRYYKKFGVGSSTVHCQVIQNNYQERCSHTYTL